MIYKNSNGSIRLVLPDYYTDEYGKKVYWGKKLHLTTGGNDTGIDLVAIGPKANTDSSNPPKSGQIKRDV